MGKPRDRRQKDLLRPALDEIIDLGHPLARVAVDTIVQPKAVAFPTDARLMHTAIVMLGRLARKHAVPLRQSYVRVAKWAALMAGRYPHAKQFKRHNREPRFLRTRLGRLIRDVRRKTADDEGLRAAFATPLSRTEQVRRQRQRRRGWKLYFLHAPEVECIGKGTWEGSDEMDQASGDGDAELQPDGSLIGEIRFHHGGDSTFKAHPW